MSFGYFFGVRSDISGNDYDDANAPWHELEPLYETCSECNGDGGIYYNDNGDEINVADYERLSDEDKTLWTFAECEHCDGIGTIVSEPYIPDYDRYD